MDPPSVFEECREEVDAELWAAATVHLIHNYSLVHDDIHERDVERCHGRRGCWMIAACG